VAKSIHTRLNIDLVKFNLKFLINLNSSSPYIRINIYFSIYINIIFFVILISSTLPQFQPKSFQIHKLFTTHHHPLPVSLPSQNLSNYSVFPNLLIGPCCPWWQPALLIVSNVNIILLSIN